MRTALTSFSLAVALASIACGEGGEPSHERGTLSVTMRAELGELTTKDGWTLQFDSMSASVRGLTLGSLSASEPQPLALSDGAEQTLGQARVQSGSYGNAHFTVERVELAGSANKDGVQLSFDWQFEAPTHYVRCGEPTRVPADGQGTLRVSLEPAQLFRSSLVADEPLSFQAIADADSGDLEVVGDELWSADVGNYELGSQRNVSSLWEFIEALVPQLATVAGVHCETADR